ncbi:DUF724 domain-containing protein 1 isoform X2 [Daucus carota subsp. sativus]|uniref:DUF724 domain-containing protein 1 isoform X2 n=1 Tax=Daucus carota subsp. sativus TaxID=79200 RepID=UPI003083779A
MFTEGTAVEVSFKEEKHDVWHVGTVMKVTGINKFLVKFQCPGDDDDEQEVSSSDVRPSPPSAKANNFALREEVEAYFECCWRSGVVKELLVDRRYLVFIKQAKTEMIFDIVNLRPRMVWIDGKWSNEAKSIKESTERGNSAKRKRGRPKKLPKKQIGKRITTDMKVSCVGNEAKPNAENNFLNSTTFNDIPNDGNSGILEIGASHRHNSARKTTNTPLLEGQAGEAVLTERVSQPKNFVSNGHGELNNSVDIESHYEGALHVGRQEGFGTAPLKGDTMESYPLQKDGPNRNLIQCAESNNKGGELGPPATSRTDAMGNEVTLPFVKRSPVWKYIDSLETYKKMAQKPHFSPLYRNVEENHEGLAISLMVNFHNLVENTSKLRFSSDIAVIERGLEALAKFKSHGFDVENVQACLTQLLLKKQKAEELQKECDDTRSKISNSSHKGELDEEISRLCQKLKEIEKELSQAKLKKENRDTDSSALQSRMHAVAENIKSIQVEFESIVGSLGK